MKLLKLISEIKKIGPEYEKAAELISIRVRKAGTDISDERPGYKYGAYSYESWGIVAWAMNRVGIDVEATDYDAISKFVSELKISKFIYLEW